MDNLDPSLSCVQLCFLLDSPGVRHLQACFSHKLHADPKRTHKGHRKDTKRGHTQVTLQFKRDTYTFSDENLTARPLSRFMRTTTIKKTKMRKKM